MIGSATPSALMRLLKVVMFCLMMLSLLTVVFQLLTDLLYAVVDPRIRYS